MTLKADGKSSKSTLINKKTVLLFLQLSFIVLILLVAGLAPIGSSAQSILSISSPFGPNPAAFPPRPISPELSAVQKGVTFL
jgi:hypothetical protein